jgi:hypothetical protein
LSCRSHPATLIKRVARIRNNFRQETSWPDTGGWHVHARSSGYGLLLCHRIDRDRIDRSSRHQSALDANWRDWQGRYATGQSGNPAGRPRGALNRATRIAAELLDGEAEALWRAEIDLALAGDRVLLRHCNDRIIAPQRAQPVTFAMPRIKDAADLAAAMGALIGAAARGLITPAEAETLARSCETSARTIEIGERIGRECLAAEQEAVERRFALRTAALLFYGVREIDEEAGGIDYRLRELSKPILRIGEAALAALAAIPDTPELVETDRAFLAAHPPRLDRVASPLSAAMGGAWAAAGRVSRRRHHAPARPRDRGAAGGG